MSLDIYVITPEPIFKKSTGIYVRINGETKELTKQEALEMFPEVEPDSIIENIYETDEIWHGNITHNLGVMARACECSYPKDFCNNLYDLLWRDEYPENVNTIEYVSQLIDCYQNLIQNKIYFETFNPKNGWGTYEQLCRFVRKFIQTLIDNPICEIEYSI